ncbi:MAG: ATP-binding response regulator [Thainema sp.]
MTLPNLRQFIEPVPSCYRHDCLEQVFQWLQSDGVQNSAFNTVVILDADHYPIGTIRPLSLVTWLINHLPSFSDWHITLEQFIATQAQPNLIQPVTVVSVALPISQLPIHDLPPDTAHLAVVDQNDHYLGLVNLTRLIQSTRAELNQPSWLPPKRSSGQVKARQASQPLPIGYESISLQTEALEALSDHEPWVQIFDRVPIPLMLQTEHGQVLKRNRVWRSQVGDVTYAAAIHPEAIPSPQFSNSPEHRPSTRSDQRADDSSGIHLSQPVQPSSTAKPTRSTSMPEPERTFLTTSSTTSSTTSMTAGSATARQIPDGLPVGYCQLEAETNTHLCACLNQDGEVHVWRFVRIDLGFSAQQLLTVADQMPLISAALASSTVLPPPLATQIGDSQVQQHHQIVNETELLPLSNALLSERVWLVVAQDTTTQRQLSQELAAKNADLVQLNRFKDEFLACISHELKTPLTAVLGLSHLLKNQALGQLNQRQARYTHLIHESSRHLMAIVNDILDLTRIETGQLDLNFVPITLRTVCDKAIRQAYSMVQLVAPQSSTSASSAPPVGQSDPAAATSLEAETGSARSQQIILDIDPKIHTMYADELRLQQMLTHLLSNALKFTELGDQTGLRVRLWDGWIAFTVWDTGIGIPQKKQHLIFQKFQQLENPLTRQVGGTGLGLVLTQRLARLHGGDVTFTSTEGEGSEFTLLLPPAPPQEQLNLNLDLAMAIHQPSPNRLVLIVEAVPRFLEDLHEKVAQLGYRVAIARSGPEALEKIRRLQPCAIFVNPLLPMLSGWDLLTLLKTDEDTCRLPVIMTGTPVEEEQAIACGADSFLTLPVQTTLLQTVLDRLEEPEEPNESLNNLQGITALYLGADLTLTNPAAYPTSLSGQLNQLLHTHHCHVLEADDLDQAEMLARVWKPNVLLIGTLSVDPLVYLQQLSDHEFLSTLPIVPLTPEFATVIDQVPQLRLFPYQPNAIATSISVHLDGKALLRMIQTAVGLTHQPHICLLDPAMLSASQPDSVKDVTEHSGRDRTVHPSTASPTHAAKIDAAKGLVTLAHYLQASGIQAQIGQTWQSVEQQVYHHTTDLLLISLQPNWSQSNLLHKLSQFRQSKNCPLILAIMSSAIASDQEGQESLTELRRLCQMIVPASIPVRELLNQIHQLLSHGYGTQSVPNDAETIHNKTPE